MLDLVAIGCPYCGEPLELLVDASAGDQQYTEDCQVCCQPMVVRTRLDTEGRPEVDAIQEDEIF